MHENLTKLLRYRLKVEMKNAPSFLGYSRLSAEITAGAIDHREQIDLSTEHPLPSPDAPLRYNLLAPNQWPSPEVLPSFRQTFSDYMKKMGEISIYFTSLIAEAIELPADAFNKYFDKDQQHKLKIVKYPDVGTLGKEGKEGNQGVGPHKDSSMLFISFLFSPLSSSSSRAPKYGPTELTPRTIKSAIKLPPPSLPPPRAASPKHPRRMDRLPPDPRHLGRRHRPRSRGPDTGRLREHHASGPFPRRGRGLPLLHPLLPGRAGGHHL